MIGRVWMREKDSERLRERERERGRLGEREDEKINSNWNAKKKKKHANMKPATKQMIHPPPSHSARHLHNFPSQHTQTHIDLIVRDRNVGRAQKVPHQEENGDHDADKEQRHFDRVHNARRVGLVAVVAVFCSKMGVCGRFRMNRGFERAERESEK